MDLFAPKIVSRDMPESSATSFQKIFYALPTIPAYFLVGPLAVVHGIYAKHFGLSLATIAMVLLVARLFDAVSDPVIGYCSDRYHAKNGTRKPFVVIGGLLLVISSYFLFSPVPSAVSSVYFLLCFLAWYFAFSLFEIPQLSWGAELVVDSQARTKLYGFRNLGANIGLLLFYLVPLLPFFSSNDFTPKILHWVVLSAATLMIPSLWLCFRLTPNGRQIIKQPYNKNYQAYTRLTEMIHEVANNIPLLLFLASFFLFGIGAGMHFSLQFIVIDVYLDLGKHFSLVNMIGLGVGSLLIVVCVKWAHCLNKKLAWMIGVLIYILGIITFSVLKPGETSLSSLAGACVLIYSGASVIGLVIPALLADIIDYSIWKFSADRAATYFSLQTFSIKTTAALGSALGLGVAGWYGFDAAATVHTPRQANGLQLAAFWLPITILLLSLISIAIVPMSNRRHKIIRRRLDARLLRVRTSSSAQTISPLPSKFIAVSD